MIPGSFDNIPHELRDYPQWITWRPEYKLTDADDIDYTKKPTKVPYQPWPGGKKAAPNRPAEWGTFEAAAEAPLSLVGPCHPNADPAQTGFSGIGFMFSDADPYTGIDIDDVDGDEATRAIKLNVLSGFPSYRERSPSGTGWHIIVRGRVPHGRRRGGIEVYSTDRFFTMTGDAPAEPVPITDCSERLGILYEQMGGENGSMAGIQPDREATLNDAAVVDLLRRDPALAALHDGDTRANGGDYSAAEQALCNALAARSRNRAQVERIWLASPLGQRHKTQRRYDYRKRTIERAFDRAELAPVRHNFTVNGQQFGPAPLAVSAGLTLIDAADLASRSPLPHRDMWGGFVAAGQVTYIVAPGGVGKSLFLQQLASSVATGALCLGIRPTKAVALYITCEDDANELHRRQIDICRALGVSLGEHPQRLGLVSLAGLVGNELATFDSLGRMTATPRYYEIAALIANIGASFVVLDNVAHFFAGNENIRNHVAAFLALLNKLAADTGAAIVLVGHPNKSGLGASGSTAWVNQVRMVNELHVPQDANGNIPDYNARCLERTKANYGKAGERFYFRWYRGAFVLPNQIAAADHELAKAQAEETAFLECLAAATSQQRATSHMKGTNYAPVMFARMPEAGGLNKLALERAMERLFHKGLLLSGQFLWRDSHRKAKESLKAVEKCGDPLAATPQ